MAAGWNGTIQRESLPERDWKLRPGELLGADGDRIAVRADRNGVGPMSLLILLSIPALLALLCMVAGFTVHTLYLRLQSRPCKVIPFPDFLRSAPRPKAS